MSKLLMIVPLLILVSQSAHAISAFKTLVCEGKVDDFGKSAVHKLKMSQTLTVQDKGEPNTGLAGVSINLYNGEIQVGATGIETDKPGARKPGVVIHLNDKTNQVGLLSGTGAGSLLNGGYVPEGEGTLLNYNRVTKDGKQATLSVIVQCELK